MKRRAESITTYGVHVVKGRKVRNLTTGKMYPSKYLASDEVLARRSRHTKRLWREKEDVLLQGLRKGIINSRKKFDREKFIETMREANKLRREKFKRKIKHLKEKDPIQYRYLLSKQFEDYLFPVITQPKFFKKLGYTLKHCRNGKEVVRFIQCERDKTVGVVEYAPEFE